MDVIDLSNLPSDIKKLLTAGEEKGCFRVINHGIPKQLQMDMKEAVASFFNLPANTQLHNKNQATSRTLSKSNDQANPILQTFAVENTASIHDIEAICSQLQDISPHHRYVIKTYASEVHSLAINIASKIANSLGLEDYSFEGWSGLLRPNKYNFSEETVGSVAFVTHTDSGLLTVLQEDEAVGGLEMMDKSGTFYSVNSVPDSFIVFLGDVAKAWSNGRLHNVKHRVVCKDEATRITIPLFLMGRKDGVVEAPDMFVDSDCCRVYRAFDYQDYVNFIISENSFTGDALLHYMLTDTANV